MNKKKELIKKLKGLKKFKLSWVEELEKTIEVEALDEKEANAMFFDGRIDWDKAEETDSNWNEHSLMIEEIE